jgi:hypothetical protein
VAWFEVTSHPDFEQYGNWHFMTDSHEQAYFLERFELVKEMLHDGDVESATASLVDLREKGFINRELDQQISVLRDEPTEEELEQARAWADKVIASINSYGGDVFQMVEELSDAATGISEAEWVPADDDDPEDGGTEPLESVDDLSGEHEVGEFDEFGDLDEFSDLEEFSDLAGFSELEDIDNLDDLSELEEFSDFSDPDELEELDDVPVGDDDVDDEDLELDEAFDELSEPSEDIDVEDVDEISSPSVDFAMLDESPSQVVEELSEEHVDDSERETAQQDAVSPDFPHDGDESDDGNEGETAENPDFHLSEISEQEFADEEAAEEPTAVEESEDLEATREGDDHSGLGAASESDEEFSLDQVSEEGDEDPFAMNLDLDDMDFDDASPSPAETAESAGDEQRGVSEEILLEDAVEEVDEDADVVETAESDGVSVDDRATKKHKVPETSGPGSTAEGHDPSARSEAPELGGQSSAGENRVTKEHQAPDSRLTGGTLDDESEVDEAHGNATKVAGLNEDTSNKQPEPSDFAGGTDASDAEFRETRKRQSVDKMAASMADEDSDGADEDEALGAADDGFQLFSDSEAEQMGLSYSSAADDESSEEASAVDPFDDEEELDPFEDDLGDNPFADDDIFADVDAQPDDADDSPSRESSRMPDSPSGEARYRGAQPSPPAHRRSSSGEIRPGSGERRFDDLSDAFADDAESGEESSPDNQFTREKTQRNESLAELASSMKASETAESQTGPEDGDEDDDFDLGLSNPEEKNESPKPAASMDEDDDFDLGLSNPEEKNQQWAIPAPGSVADESDSEGIAGPGSVVEESSEPEEQDEVSQTFFGALAPFQRDESEASDQPEQQTQERHREPDTSGSKPRIRFESSNTPAPSGQKRDLQPTPASLSAISSSDEEPSPDDSLDEEEFFDLADSLAQESEGSQAKRPKYRGEPMVVESDVSEASGEVGGSSSNPFAHEAPTGVQEALRESESSFVLEEIPSSDAEEQVAKDVLLDEAERLFEKGKYESAKDLVSSVLERDDEHEDALELQRHIEDELVREYNKKLGSLDQTPELKIGMGEIANLDLDSRAGFLLSQMDGFSSINDLLELSNMSRAETLSVLADLLERDIISLK